jgi:ribosomal protein S18 acetylase RimI-like enzyme
MPSSTAAFALHDMTPADYEAVMALWNSAPGVRASETFVEFERILARNPGLSCVAIAANDNTRAAELAGAVLCCHDGRRGYLYHLAVAEKFRRQALGRQLVDRCLSRLKAEGIQRCTIFLVAGNAHGEAFWRQTEWFERTDLKAFAKDLG